MAWTTLAPAAALDLKFPEWLLFVVTHDGAGHYDLMPAGWAMQCSLDPPMLAVALHAQRYSLAQIRATGEFGLAFAGLGQHELITWSGTRSGREVDKFAAYPIRHSPGSATGVPLIDGCALAFECRLASELPAGDHVIVTGHIAAAHRAEPPVSKLVNFGGWYAPAVAAPDDVC
ncbi:MAG: flavin reductase family protein [Armatimonadetes bacterium]|nr:flavin reductase family protein [Armatimonadota bacterium]